MGACVATGKEAVNNVDVTHVDTMDMHVLILKGNTLKKFKGGLTLLIELVNELTREKIPEIPEVPEVLTIERWISTNCVNAMEPHPNNNANIVTIGVYESYVLGLAITHVLFTAQRMFQSMMNRDRFCDWKDCSDLKRRNYYHQMQLSVQGLTAIRGYADFVLNQVPMFTCLLSVQQVSENDNINRVFAQQEIDKVGSGIKTIKNPSFAIIGDCHPEFWCNEALRTPLRGYIGLRRDCTRF